MNEIILEKVHDEREVPVSIFSKLLENRIIFIDDLFNDKAAVDVIAALFYLDRISNDKITLFINADGGYIRNVFGIYDAMKLASSTLETFCIGAGTREAVLIVAAGTKGHRFLTKHSNICISQVSPCYVGYSDLVNTEISHRKNAKDNDVFFKELAQNIDKDLKELRADTERQLFLTPTQAVAYGIADKVM